MRYRKTLIVAATLLLLYALAGFFVLPPIVRGKLIGIIEETTHRTVQLRSVSVNPFALSLTLDDFELKDRDSSTLVSFKEMYVNYEIQSLFRNAIVLSAFTLDTPYVAIRVMPDGNLSIHDLLHGAARDTSANAGSPRQLIVEDVVISRGTILYQDKSRAKPMVRMMDSLDLSLKNFTTVPREEGDYEFEASTRQNEHLHWKGQFSFTPLRSSGRLEVDNVNVRSLREFMGDRLKFGVESGTLNFRGDYTADLSTDTTHFKLRSGSVGINRLVLTAPGDSVPAVEVPGCALTGISVDYPENVLVIDSVRLDGGSLRTAYLADGTITLQDLLTPVPDPRDTAKSGLRIRLNNLVVSGTTFTFIDRMLEPEAAWSLANIQLGMTGLTYGTPGTASFKATAVPNGAGSAIVGGTLSLTPQKADLELRVAGAPLGSFQPYASRYSRAQILSGTFSLGGKAKYSTKGTQTMFRFLGDMSMEKGRIADPSIRQDLARWARVDIRNIDYNLAPPSLSIREIAAREPYVRVIVGPDRRLNLQDAMLDDSASAKPAGAAKNAMLTVISKISVMDGSMNFADLTLTPPFSTGIQYLNGTIKGLSSRQLERADVDLAGKVDASAPATIKGQINPLSEEAYTDIVMKFEGMNLTSYNPYFTKFAGYAIDRGTISLDLHYRLNKRYLDAENKIVINQLTLGEKFDGPDVTSLPVKLCIALLKDSQGVIDLDVPVSGSVDDPEFSLFPIILKALLHLLLKIVTAPFALIGALFGGGEDLDHIGFLPGADTMTVDQSAKLAPIAKGLSERPGLRLELCGTASDSLDGHVLALQSLLRRVRTSGSGPWTREEEERMLELYRRTFGEDPAKGFPGEESESRKQQIVEFARQRLAGATPVPPDDLRHLAQRRAAGIMHALLSQNGVDSSRVVLQEVKLNGTVSDGLVHTAMVLAAP